MYIYLVNTQDNIRQLPPFEDTDAYFLEHGLKKSVTEFVDYFNSQILASTVKIRAIADESKVTLEIEVTDENIDDIMTTALEGGINYWVSRAWPKDKDFKGREFAHEVISVGGTLMIDPGEGEDIVELTKEKFMAGLKKYMEENNISEVDPGDIDADGADLIVQYALFNDLVYS